MRRKQELERRRVQQKARKDDKRAAHRKYTARLMAKKHLVGLKENALRALVDQGMLVEPLDRAIHEEVMPWLLEQMGAFMVDEEFVEANNEDVVTDAFETGKNTHKQAILNEQKRKQDLIQAEENKKYQKELERQARR